MKKVFLFILVLCPLLASAQGFQVNLHGQKQIGMGGAGTGLKMDVASVYYNPGAMSMLAKNGVSAGISPLFLKSTFVENGSNTQYNNSSQIATPFQGYAVWGPEGSRFKFGLGAYTPYGGLISWGSNWPGKKALQSLDLKVIYFQPTVSFKISDKLGIGVGLVYGIGNVTLKKSLRYTDSNGQQDFDAQLKGHGHGFGYNIGIYFQPVEKFSVGLTYHSRVDAKVTNGDATFNVPASISPNFPNKFSSTIPLASIISLGFGYHATEKLTLAFDINYTGWKAYDTLLFTYDKTATSQLQFTKEPRNYENSFNFRLGGQYKVTDAFAARLGLSYGKTPIKDGYVSPDVPDADRVEFAAGLGYKISDHFNIDASFLFADLKKRKQTNINTGLNGTYKTYVFIPGLSVTYNF